MIIIGIFFVRRIQPIIIILRLIIIRIIYSFYIYIRIGGFWFRYLLLLVIIRGVLVVFTYIVSLFPNERFEIYNLIIIIIVCLLRLYLVYEMCGLDYRYISLNIWFFYIGIFSLYLVRFLLIIIIIVVWIRCLNEGAIRVN